MVNSVEQFNCGITDKKTDKQQGPTLWELY